MQKLVKRGTACLLVAALLLPGSLAFGTTAYAAAEEENEETDSVLSADHITLKAGEEAVIRLESEDLYYPIWQDGGASCISTELSEDRMEATVKGVMPGTATLTVSDYFGIAGSCEITVEPGEYSFPERKITMVEGETYVVTMPSNCVTRVTAESSGSYFFDWFYGYNRPVTVTQNSWLPNTFTITAREEGTAQVYAYFYENASDSEYLYADVMEVEVLARGIAETQKVMLPGEEDTLRTAGMMENLPMTWSSSNPSVASVDASGKVTAHTTGSTTITLIGYDSYGMYGTYTCELNVYDPKLSAETLEVSTYSTAELAVEDAGDSPEVVWSSSDPQVAEYSSYRGGVWAYSEGTCVITAEVYGRTLTCEVTVLNPHLNDELVLLTEGKTKTIEVEDVPSGSSVSYTSGDTSVAAVNRSGKITAKGEGSTAITVSVDEKELTCVVVVADSRIIETIQAAEDAIGSPYSNEKRMQDGYYDCSSLVWKSYKEAGVSVGSSTYAPTAAGMAEALVKQGKDVAYEMVGADELKPGDLIFYGGSNNGRYKGIWHVALYCGSYETEYTYWGGETFTAEYGVIIDAGTGSGGVRCKTIGLGSGTDDSVVLIARPLS